MNRKVKTVPQPVSKGHAKVPQIMQMEALECGAACLTMILSYYQKWLPLEQVRKDCGVSRDGSNAKNVLRAARAYGLEAKGYRLEVEDLQKEGNFPCIVHWNFNHFIVLAGFSGKNAVINDPAKGEIRMPIEEFDKGFTGIVLRFKPTDDFEMSGKPRSVLAFAKQRMQGNWRPFIFLAITTVISSIISVINPAFSRIFIDRILASPSNDWLVPFLYIFGGVTILSLFVSLLSDLFMLKVGGKIDVTENSKFFWRILHLPMEFFSQRMAGDVLSRANTNATIAETLIRVFAPLLLQFIMMFLYLFVILRYSVLLSVIGIVSLVLNLVVSKVISYKRIRISRVSMRDSGKLEGATVAGIEMMETIKSSGAENGFFQKWSGYQAAVNTSRIKSIKLDAFLGSVPNFINTLTGTAILMLGVYLTIKGSFTVGIILAFQGFMASFTSPAMSLISANQGLQEMRTNMERIEDVMNYPIEEGNGREWVEGDDCDKLSGELELKNITFGYSRLTEPIIKDFSMKIPSGSKIAFVGTSGCGKSTLTKLISGLYQPWSGEILFDGKPRVDYCREVMTGSIAVVDQDVILFEDTIANNIKMWDNSIEDFEMILAARDAQMHEDILQREGGYQYKLTEGGKDFSGGQRQRMEIARVLAQEPTIIILDEATSALDAKTEYNVVNSINARGVTCIVIAHRLSTIRDCDEIVVMDKGVAVERGTHDELYKKGGYYAQLVSNE